MKSSSHPPQKLKTTPPPLFSCGFFRHCTQTVLSPTTSTPPPPLSSLPPPSPPPLPPPPQHHHPRPTQQPPTADSSSSSSSNTSQSFTQWKFPLPYPSPPPPPQSETPRRPPPPPVLAAALTQLFHETHLHFGSGSDSDQLNALHALERSLVPNPPAAADAALCPPPVMAGVLGYLKDPSGAKSATKVLFALCLSEGNRRVAVEGGASGRVVEALADLEGAVAERALAALELLCRVEEGAEEVRAHALAVPMLVEVMGKMAGRGKEYAIGVLAVIYGGNGGNSLAPPEEVGRAVALALQGDCTARGRRKGAQLLRMLQDNGWLDLSHQGQ